MTIQRQPNCLLLPPLYLVVWDVSVSSESPSLSALPSATLSLQGLNLSLQLQTSLNQFSGKYCLSLMDSSDRVMWSCDVTQKTLNQLSDSDIQYYILYYIFIYVHVQ